MKDVAASAAKDWAFLALTGLGVTFHPHEWIGGLFLALAGAAFAMKIDPEQDRRELWVVMLGAFLASHFAAMVSYHWWPSLSVQLVMAAAGFMSRPITRIALRTAGLVESRSDRIADKIVDRILPDEKDER